MIELDPPTPKKPETIRESEVEAYLVKQVAKHGGRAEKFVSPNRRCVPDRLVLWPDRPRYRAAEANFVECKRPGAKPAPGQLRDHAAREALGFQVFIVHTKAEVDGYIRNMTY